uniref:NADH-ubiquinone oxidoreductase chain 6 n=1 Tax=Parapercis sexfasciata TaxID=261519 RepID=A0A679EM45_9TELE|nr:NADH dehydrogenase subunit 6 [Parapercis sexfasciata]
MSFMAFVFMGGLTIGMVGVASNPSPYYGALGLVLVAGMGCGGLVVSGGSFLSLVLFLIYLGGMLVVFAYSAALAAEPFPESWWSLEVGMTIVFYFLGIFMVFGLVWEGWYEVSWLTAYEQVEFCLVPGDVEGVALMYAGGGGLLVVAVWVLLLALFVVLELTRGLSRGAIRAV